MAAITEKSIPILVAEPPRQFTMLQKLLMQTVSGGSAGFIEVCIMQPLDVVKTRLQLQSSVTKSTGVYYNGVFDCFSKMIKNEGILSCWKGILPPILVETPKRALKFVCFEQYKPLFMFGSPHPTPVTFSLAGLAAGVTEAIVVNPFEVIKVAQQADRAHIKKTESTFAVTRKILQTDGFRTLTKGITATMGRNGVFNMIYFGFYHSVKDITPQYENQQLELLKKILLGFTSGTLACIFNIPFDVVKSRIQGPQPEVGKIKYSSTMKSMGIVYREEGFRALYKGLVPKVMRLGPGGAIMLIVYEHVYHLLQTKM